MPPLNCLFIVQGEGRGHMTQALALRTLLARAGHRVSGVLVGRSTRRDVPAFFCRKIGAPVTFFDSPTFTSDERDKAVRLLPTLFQNARRLGRFAESLAVIDAHVRRHRPDIVVNFFEPLAGLYYHRFHPGIPMICIGHQYLLDHPGFDVPPGDGLQRRMVRQFARITACGAARRLALSFYPASDLPEARLSVVPPLLREELLRQPLDRHEPFFLVYLLNSGYAGEIIRWHEQHPHVGLHVFWDNRSARETQAYDATLTFHRLDDEHFLWRMARCSGLACTAGFESVCEAMYLGKPVLAVPVAGHYEQRCNARDAVRAGAGISSTWFDLDRLVDFLPEYQSPAAAFHPWLSQAEERFIREIESVVYTPQPMPRAEGLVTI